MKVTQSCLALCDPWTMQSMEFHGILQGQSGWPFLHFSREPQCVGAPPLQSCPPLRSPMDGSPPGSSVHGILQARILEWVAMPSPRGSSRPRDLTFVSCVLHLQAGSLLLAPPGKASRGPQGEVWPELSATASHKQYSREDG